MRRGSRSKTIPDYLTPLLTVAPAAWALIRANEIRALDIVDFKEPVLDVGCGNGVVTKILLSNRVQKKFGFGIDLSPQEIKRAKLSKSFKHCEVASVYNLPYKKNSFETVFSNSVIEHIQDLDLTLSEISRVLKPNGQMIITVPSSYQTEYLLGVRALKQLGLNNASKIYGKFFNRLFYHVHLYTHVEWRNILKKHSLKLTDYHYYHTPAMIQTFEILAYLAIPYHLTKFIFGDWIVFPKLRKYLVVPWLKRILYPLYLADSKEDEGGSVLLIAKKVSG
jgi:ubiquinone/menaquinone biosynthesis C-methylase UbiE